MLGAIAGDVVGSRWEGTRTPTSNRFKLFTKKCRFTDDTTLSVAIAEAIMTDEDYAERLKEYYFYYPKAGYGSAFREWARTDAEEAYNSYGNGSAMRVSPVVYVHAAEGVDKVKEVAKKTAEVTHNHPEGIKGAQAIAVLAYYASVGESKEFIKKAATEEFGYDLNVKFKPSTLLCSCQDTVPLAICAFLKGESFEEVIKIAVRIGGDADTIAAMAGTIAEHYYGVPNDIKKAVFEKLDKRLGEMVVEFYKKYVDSEFDPEVEIKDPEYDLKDSDDLETLLSEIFNV